jgi:hypothetical protein
MSGHSHEEHHSQEQKPVSFSVPFYLAAATLVILFFFLSLCDPKPHHEAGHGHENAAHVEMKDDHAAHEAKASTTEVSAPAEAQAATTSTTAEAPAQEAHH